MSWNGYRLQGYVWKTADGVRHKIDEWMHSSDDYSWETACGQHKTQLGSKKPRTFKGFVTCFQCLAKGDGDP